MKNTFPDKSDHSNGRTSSLTDEIRFDSLYLRASRHIDRARENITRTIDTEIIKAYWHIGREIIEEEQHGKEKADYGKSILVHLSRELMKKYKRGFSVDNLERARKFFLMYQQGSPITYTGEISATVLRKSEAPDFSSHLSWSHYLLLMKIKRPEARTFYEIEASRNNWSSRELKRQIGSLLFDRLSKSKNKAGLLELACKGQEINCPEDIIKDPVVLEFLGIPESSFLVESKLEAALIENLQHFLLELGKGFAFVARQKRLTLDSNHFYADLIFYHIILKCYVILDLKTHELSHADLGQMQLYVNYFDQEVKSENDNPTIGIILCTSKSDAMVKYFLGDRVKQIFASTYQFHLPTEAELEAELKREIREIEYQSQE